MKILVTGATGFLGGHIVRRLLCDGHTVRILRRENSSLADLQGLPFEDFIGDITEPESVAAAVSGMDAVIHAAARISYWSRDAGETMHVNAYGTQCVAHAALEAGVKRFVYVSSVMAVGIPEPGTLGDEAMPYNFNRHPNPYSASKHAGELFLRDLVGRGLHAVTVNPGAIIGPIRSGAPPPRPGKSCDTPDWQSQSSFAALNQAHGAVEGEAPAALPMEGATPVPAIDRRRAVGGLFFPGRINRYFFIEGGMSAVDVEDVVDGINRAMEKGRAGERYLLTGENVSYRKMREVIAEEMGELKPFIPIPTKLLQLSAGVADVLSYWTHRRPRISRAMAEFLPFELYYSSAKAQRELGWTCRPFRDSVKSAVAWYKSSKSSTHCY